MNDPEEVRWHIEKIYHHVEVLNREYGEICERMASVETALEQFQKILWLIFATLIANGLAIVLF